MRSRHAICLLFVLSACASANEGASLSVRQEMVEVVDPLSKTLFAIQGEVDPANEAPPASAARWREAWTTAERMQAIARSLQTPGRARDGGEWMSLAQEMADRSGDAAKAAQARDGAAFSDAVNALADNCFACHGKYLPKPAA